MDLPEQGQLGVKVRDLGRLAGRQLPNPRQTSLIIGLSLARHSLGRVGSGFARAIPGIGAIAGGIEARRTLILAARRMVEVYSRAWRGGDLLTGPVEDAIELSASGLATSTSPS
jgi:hypothetical protein